MKNHWLFSVVILFVVHSMAYPQMDYTANINMDGEEFSVKSEQIVKKTGEILAHNKKVKRAKLSKAKIKKIAKEYNLFEETETNPHLSFLDGDISYWYEQELSEKRYRLEFSARMMVLQASDESAVIIEDQGKLSWAAQQVIAKMLKAQADIKKKKLTTK